MMTLFKYNEMVPVMREKVNIKERVTEREKSLIKF